MMKNLFSLFCGLALCLWFSACGDSSSTEEITRVVQSTTEGVRIVDSAADLPECGEDSEGKLVWVDKLDQMQVCEKSRWHSLDKESVSGTDTVKVSSLDTVDVDENIKKASCSTKPLADGRGVKIVCGGDSVGVVLNGGDGSYIEDPAGCFLSSIDDSIMAVKCGEKLFEINVAKDKTFPVCSESGDEDEDCSLDESVLTGYSQKGPYVKGTSVIAYELRDGKSLLQTGKNFVGSINNDKGLFDIRSVKLSSQYARLEASGFYRNEVTGNTSNSTLKLRALTNLKGRRSANINLLTHLEYDRIFYLVTHKGMKVSDAKKQAEKELLNAFNFDAGLLNLTGNSEDLAIFGESERSAVLLAISVILQGDRSESELSSLLTSFSADFAEDGEWDDVAMRLQIAEWTSRKDLNRKYADYRSNVEKWDLGTVPAFEKYMHLFWTRELGLHVCDGNDVKKGDVQLAKNGEAYECVDETLDKYEPRIFKDFRDGQLYKAVTIGQKTWMAENLNYNYDVRTPDGSQTSSCYQDDCSEYGRYYTWSAAMDSAALFSDMSKNCGYGVNCRQLTYLNMNVRGACPEGWHVPSDDDWTDLYSSVGESPTVLMAKGYEKWPDATDDYGFSIRPAGNGITKPGSTASFWTWKSGESTKAYVWHIAVNYYEGYKAGIELSGMSTKSTVHNVRCILD